MSAIFALWISLIIMFLFCRFPVGLYLYIVYIFLVPYMQIHVGTTLSWNLVNLFVVLATIMFARKEHIRVEWSILSPFIILYVVQLFIMPFQKDVPFDFMFNAFRVSVMNTLVVPSALLVLCQSKKVDYSVLMYILLACITVACMYGLLLTLTPGVNPYIMVVSEINDVDYLERYLTAEDSGRLFGRISSVFSHPMTFACFLGLSLLFVLSIKDSIKKWLFYPIIGLIAVNCFTCGVRSVLGGLAVAGVYYLYRQRSFKTAAIFCVVCFVGYVVITNIPELNSYLGSITQQSSDNVGGSSIEMRLEQLDGAFAEFEDSPIFGKGYLWHSYYLSKYGAHPVLLYFESLIYIILCNSGIIGCFLWFYIIMKYIHVNDKLLKDSSLLNALLAFYIAYACITGDGNYLQYFIIIYIIMFYTCHNNMNNLQVQYGKR